MQLYLNKFWKTNKSYTYLTTSCKIKIEQFQFVYLVLKLSVIDTGQKLKFLDKKLMLK